MPLMAFLFGEIIDSFGNNQFSPNVKQVSMVKEVCLKFVYLGIGTGVAAFLQVTCWMVTGERQAARIRGLYLKAILRQDIAFFDKKTNTREVIGRMSGDTVVIQDDMGEKVGRFLQLVATFFGGFVIAFIKGWLLTVVMLSIVPLVVVVAATTALIIGMITSRGQSTYVKASQVVEETIGSIRTVASFIGEKRAVSTYKKFLANAYKSVVHEGLVGGIAFGMVLFVMFYGYGLSVFSHSFPILQK